MSRSHRYALVCLLVGCVPPPAGGYPAQTYPPSQYQQPPGGYDAEEGYDDDGYGNAGYGDGDDGNQPRNSGNARNRGGARAAPRAAGQWSCTAEASFGTAIGEGSMDYSVKTGYGTAATRGEAVNLALKDCGETVNLSILIAEDMRTEVGNCRLARCNQIGR